MPQPSALVLKIETFQNLVISIATGGERDAQEYKLLRADLISQPEVNGDLPNFVHTCRDVDQFWQFIKYKHQTYQERRDYLWDCFRPILEQLEQRGVSPAHTAKEDILKALSAEGVEAAWEKALARLQNDPEGAITASRALLETVCKHIMDELHVVYGDHDDLPKLYRSLAGVLNLAPAQHSEQIFKQILTGCISVVEGLGALRNRHGDAHGAGAKNVRPAARHARLAVNLACSTAAFIVETWVYRQSDIPG